MTLLQAALNLSFMTGFFKRRVTGREVNGDFSREDVEDPCPIKAKIKRQGGMLAVLPVKTLSSSEIVVESGEFESGEELKVALQFPNDEPIYFIGKAKQQGKEFLISIEILEEQERNRLIRMIGELRRLGEI